MQEWSARVTECRSSGEIRAACDALYETPVPEYDISADGIIVHCRANAKYLHLSEINQIGTDEPILSRFRYTERVDVIRIMEIIAFSGSINNAEAREATGRSKPATTRLLAKMLDCGLITSQGAGPAVRYIESDQKR